MATLEFFFDLSSPYSYLAHSQLDGVVARTGATLEVKPFVLGAVFKASGNSKPAEIAAKALYMARDIPAWARDYGIPYQFASAFPFNGIKAQRMVLAAADVRPGADWTLTKAFFTAFWGHDRDPGDVSVLAAIANESGLDGAALVARTDEQAIKDRLRAFTDDAIARGAFGAPSMFVGDQYFIGNDRLPFVERALKGERIYVE